MILIYPHTLDQYKKNFDKLKENVENMNSTEEWSKIKIRSPRGAWSNAVSEGKNNNLNLKSTKNFKDEASQTRFILKKNKETSCSPAKFQENTKESIFEDHPNSTNRMLNGATPRSLSAAGIASGIRNRKHSISLLNDSSNSNIFENRDSETFTNIGEEFEVNEKNKRKRGDVTAYNEDLLETNNNKKQKDDYRVVEKDGAVYTVVGDPEDIHDNGDVHDIIEQTDQYYKTNSNSTPSPVAARTRSGKNLIKSPKIKVTEKQVKWQKL